MNEVTREISRIEAEAQRAAGWVENHLPGHAKPQPDPAVARPAQQSQSPQPEEPPVSLSADLHAIAAKAEAGAARLELIGEDVAVDVEAIQSNPEYALLFATMRSLVKLGPAAGLVTIVGSGLSALEKQLLAQKAQRDAQAQQQAAQQPPAPMQPKQASFTPADSATAQAPVVR